MAATTKYLSSTYADTYLLTSVVLGISSLFLTASTFFVTTNPMGRFTSGSPATSFWQAVILSYESFNMYVGLRRLFYSTSTEAFLEPYEGIFKYLVPIYLQVVLAVGSFGAAVAWFFNAVQDEGAIALCLLNTAVIAFNYVLGLEIGINTVAVSRNQIMRGGAQMKKKAGMVIYTLPPHS